MADSKRRREAGLNTSSESASTRTVLRTLSPSVSDASEILSLTNRIRAGRTSLPDAPVSLHFSSLTEYSTWRTLPPSPSMRKVQASSANSASTLT